MYSHPHPYQPGVALADLNPATAGAYHTSEVPYFLLTQDVYNRIRKTRAWQDYDRLLADRMSNVLIAFAAAGDPSTGEVQVPKFTAGTQQFMDFGDEIRVRTFDVPRMDFLATVNMPGAVGPGSSPRAPRD
jgi:para-nitrobenzyl esterase